MAKEIPSVGDLRRKSDVTDEEIDAAADAYVANPKADTFRFASDHQVNVDAAVHAYPRAVEAVAKSDQTRMFKWTMVRTAILLAHPVKG
jgi:hypothetical protein